jgi:hypothetical protein
MSIAPRARRQQTVRCRGRRLRPAGCDKRGYLHTRITPRFAARSASGTGHGVHHAGPGEHHGKLDATSHATAAGISSGLSSAGTDRGLESHAGNAESLACRRLERMLDRHQWNSGKLGESVRLAGTPRAAPATPAAAAHTATLFAALTGSGSAIHRLPLRVPDGLRLDCMAGVRVSAAPNGSLVLAAMLLAGTPWPLKLR